MSVERDSMRYSRTGQIYLVLTWWHGDQRDTKLIILAASATASPGVFPEGFRDDFPSLPIEDIRAGNARIPYLPASLFVAILCRQKTAARHFLFFDKAG